jgi:hypothetical protein
MSTDASRAAIDRLAVLIGTWRMAAVFPDGRQGPPEDTAARTVFEYGPGDHMLIQRWQVPHPAAPDGIAIITVDRARDGFLQHYFDDRGVVRLYQMTFAAGFWTLERTAADFSPLDFAQRWEAELAADGETIRGRWLHRGTSGEWSEDFSLTYNRLPES